ncbi:sugar phosphate isomerase/epimerase [Pseudarthrobacter sp. J64]|uniref:sugar phosphate isomerase/epimerase family protein n=1 Tax=Pseudarthrobacter sp. J64 TaxID=3116485 RepID=UPI002E801409|nr:sugar phosphate isomerase/epimerase [Pseudarthrobacter sp. J64]MEE2569142.1 sugar phosphate isomerase/epimerase [Pseudarthrobacter sp. J64]
MKLAFSSLGMPGAGIDELIRIAEAGGAEGLELRLGEDEAVSVTMSGQAAAAARRRVEGAGLSLISISSYIRVCSTEPDAEVIRQLNDALELAAVLGAGGVRVFPGAQVPAGSGRASAGESMSWDRTAATRLSAVSDHASRLGVQLLLETHDSHPTGSDIARILALSEPAGTVRAIWDVLHPWRYGEQPEETASALNGSLAYCQFKDAVMGASPGDVTLTIPGHGGIPLAMIAGIAEQAIRSQGDGTFWASLEWEKAWHPELEDLPVALAALRAVLMPGDAPLDQPAAGSAG